MRDGWPASVSVEIEPHFFFLDLDRSWHKCEIAFVGLGRLEGGLGHGTWAPCCSFRCWCWIGQVCRDKGSKSGVLGCGVGS